MFRIFWRHFVLQYEVLNKGTSHKYLDAIKNDGHAETTKPDASIKAVLLTEKKREIENETCLPHEQNPTKKIKLEEQVGASNCVRKHDKLLI